MHACACLIICLCFVVWLLAGLEVQAHCLCVCIHVCSGVRHPWPASIGKSLLPLTVCLDTVYLCSDCRSRSGLCAPMYSSCSFSLPLVPYRSLSSFLSLFLPLSLPSTVCSSLSPTAARHTNTQSTQRYTSTRAFMRIFTFKYTYMHYSFSCTQGYMTDNISDNW